MRSRKARKEGEHEFASLSFSLTTFNSLTSNAEWTLKMWIHTWIWTLLITTTATRLIQAIDFHLNILLISFLVSLLPTWKSEWSFKTSTPYDTLQCLYMTIGVKSKLLIKVMNLFNIFCHVFQVISISLFISPNRVGLFAIPSTREIHSNPRDSNIYIFFAWNPFLTLLLLLFKDSDQKSLCLRGIIWPF